MRTKIVAGNWKMNKDFHEAEDLVSDIANYLDENGKPEDVDVILCPPFVYLEMVHDMVQDSPVFIGAQNISQYESGAFTGEISAGMLKSMYIDYCIIGHSERRKYFNETDDILAKKVILALKNDLTPIFCCGELLAEREAGKHFEVVETQLEKAVFKLHSEEFSRLVIAYEPVWAIGTGVNATPAQAQEMHEYIRNLVANKYDERIAQEIIILYGGSCNSKNAKDLFSNPDVDGGLIGGASLDAEEFIKIVKAAAE
jgi:triosephosphate isomerase